jgi:hypothetical protein
MNRPEPGLDLWLAVLLSLVIVAIAVAGMTAVCAVFFLLLRGLAGAARWLLGGAL